MTLATTKEELQNAPAFDMSMVQNGPAGMGKQAQNAAPMPAKDATKAPDKMAANPTTKRSRGRHGHENNQPATVDVAKISADELISTTVYDSRQSERRRGR